MNALRLTMACCAAVIAATPALAAPTLRIEHAAVNVVVTPEDRPDIRVSVYRPNARLPLTVTQAGDEVVIDGGLTGFLTSCHGSGDQLHAFVFGRGDFPLSELPQVRVYAPMNLAIESAGIVHGAVTHSQTLVIDQSACGDWVIGNVADKLVAHVSGVGSVHTGASQRADLELSGAGNLFVGPVAGTLAAGLSGTGQLTVRSSGPADLHISGAGRMTTGPITGPLIARLSGTGSLEVANLEGPLDADVSGVGAVKVNNGHAPAVTAQMSGAGRISFGGVADRLSADVSGVGVVEVARVTGPVDQHVSGIGSVKIGGR